jgi:carbamoyl-phosphate synthase small subunit
MIASGKPTFGICLGHQMIALASGMKTYKMYNGHRGINHPVKNLQTGKGEITSQNHGFAVVMEDVEKHPSVELTHVHLNDGTVAGIRRTDAPVFSVQYHPEASPGPHDSRYLFDDFVALMNA